LCSVWNKFSSYPDKLIADAQMCLREETVRQGKHILLKNKLI